MQVATYAEATTRKHLCCPTLCQVKVSNNFRGLSGACLLKRTFEFLFFLFENGCKERVWDFYNCRYLLIDSLKHVMSIFMIKCYMGMEMKMTLQIIF
jgi:hypothetical protein